MIIQDTWGNVFYVDDDEAESADENGRFGFTLPDIVDSVGMENLFHSLPKDQLEVMICLFLGMKPAEIVSALHFRNIARFYNISSRLRKSCLERKAAFMS